MHLAAQAALELKSERGRRDALRDDENLRTSQLVEVNRDLDEVGSPSRKFVLHKRDNSSRQWSRGNGQFMMQLLSLWNVNYFLGN